MKFTYAGIDIEVSAKFVEKVYGFPFQYNEKNKMYHNSYRITIQYNGNEATFPFYGSAADYQAGKVEMDENDLKTVLGCILSECMRNFTNFEDFCNEFGYDTDSRSAERRSAERTYLEILKRGKELSDMGFTQDDLCNITNEIHDQEEQE